MSQLGLWANDFFSADLDGDGDTDVAAVGQIAAQQPFPPPVVQVLLNHGNGTFAPHVPYATGLGGYVITGADLDADGDKDLAVSGNASGAVSVLLNHGNGTFGPPVQYGVGPHANGITSADFDGDGDIDLATSNDQNPGSVWVLLNQGQGSFAPAVQYAAGYFPYSVTSADLDGDGDVDLAVSNLFNPAVAGAAGTVSVLLNQGNGTFAAPVFHAVGGLGSGGYYVTNADLNGDGRADLVALNDSNDYVAIFLNQGGGAFAPYEMYPVGNSPQRAVATDLDEDGDLDLAVVNAGSSVSLLLNRGDGTFAPHQKTASGHVIRPVTHADFDGDGDSDLLVANPIYQSVTLHRNCLEQGISFCFGDGTLLTSCPCTSPDSVPTPAAATAHGCANSLNFAGAGLVAFGEAAPAPGTLTFRARIAPGYLGAAVLVKGNANATSGIAAGDGIRCVDGALVRFGAHNAGTNGAVIGNWTYPNNVQTTPVSIATAQSAGAIAYYQLLYRDAAANFCTPATTNWSNGYRVAWPP